MQQPWITLKSIAFFSSLFIAGQSAPTSPNENLPPGVTHLLKRANDCGDSTFVNQASDASPWVTDCPKIARNIAGGGSWTITGTQRTLATYGTYKFSVAMPQNMGYIGNEDIIDLINDSISQYQWEVKVGTKGTMLCNGLEITGVFIELDLFQNLAEVFSEV